MTFTQFSIGDPLQAFFDRLPRRVGVFRRVLFQLVYVVGDGQPHFAADLFSDPCRTITHKGRVVHLAVDADAVCNEVDMQVIRIFMRAGQSLMFAQIHFAGERPHDLKQVVRSEFLFVLWCYADFEAQVFVSTAFVVPVHHFELAHNLGGFPTSEQIGCDHLSEFLFAQGVVNRVAAVRYGFPFGYHGLILRLEKTGIQRFGLGEKLPDSTI